MKTMKEPNLILNDVYIYKAKDFTKSERLNLYRKAKHDGVKVRTLSDKLYDYLLAAMSVKENGGNAYDLMDLTGMNYHLAREYADRFGFSRYQPKSRRKKSKANKTAEVKRLYYEENMKQIEIARLLGCSKQNVNQLLKR